MWAVITRKAIFLSRIVRNCSKYMGINKASGTSWLVIPLVSCLGYSKNIIKAKTAYTVVIVARLQYLAIIQVTLTSCWRLPLTALSIRSFNILANMLP